MCGRICSDHFENVIIVEPEAWLLTEQGMDPRRKEQVLNQKLLNPRSHVRQWPALHGFRPILALVLPKLFGDSFQQEVADIGGRYEKIHFFNRSIF